LLLSARTILLAIGLAGITVNPVFSQTPAMELSSASAPLSLEAEPPPTPYPRVVQLTTEFSPTLPTEPQVAQLIAETQSSSPPLSSSPSTSPSSNAQSSQYLIAPHPAPKERVNPYTTTFILNDMPVSHLSEWEVTAGYDFGDQRTNNPSLTGLVKLDGKITESLTRNNVYTVDQRGVYLQLSTVRKSREVTTDRIEPQTLLGLREQLSFSATCTLEGSDPNDQCTYTPGLYTDPNSIDPDLLVPTRIVQTSNVGDVVTPESLAAIQQPGFQRGANGQEIGIDLYFPNAGGTAGKPKFLVRKCIKIHLRSRCLECDRLCKLTIANPHWASPFVAGTGL
jgi:hypothetical protein